MIQRIQTLYLILVTIVISLPLIFPIAQIFIPEGIVYYFYGYGVLEIGGGEVPEMNIPLLILYIFMILVPLVTIFLYKKRPLQIRLCIVEIILLFGCMFLMWYQIRHIANNIEATVLYKVGFILPIVSMILTWLAMRGIFKDIKLLRSYDRIR